jgi:hypothetical protein
MHYFSSLIYSREPLMRKLGHQPVWRLNNLGQDGTVQADLVMLELDSFWAPSMRRAGYLSMPQWVFFMLDISQPWPKLLRRISNKSLKNNLTKVKKAGYLYSITTDEEEWRYFYEHMYLPYAQKRYGVSSIVYSSRQHRRAFETGQLLLVHTRELKRVAGVLLLPWRQYLRFHSLGVRDAGTRYLARGVVTALYYFSMIWAGEQGYKRMDFGHCRPALGDGLLLYKKRWGMRIRRSPRVKTLIGIKALSRRPALKSFARRMDFIFLDSGRLSAVSCVGHDRPVGRDEVLNLFKKRYVAGLNRLFIIAPGGFTEETMQAIEPGPADHLSLVVGDPAKMLMDVKSWTGTK